MHGEARPFRLSCTSVDRASLETPCKFPRPLKRRRRSSGALEPEDGLARQPSETDAPASTPPPAERGWARHVRVPGGGALEHSLEESLALLDACDICRSAAVCRSWRAAAHSHHLWAAAALRLGLAARIVQREEICCRRSRGTLVRGVLLGVARQDVAMRSVSLASANAGTEDGLLPSIVREVALLKSLSLASHPGIVRLIGAEIEAEHVHIVTEFVGSSFAAWFAQPRPPTARLRALIRIRFGQLFEALAFLHRNGVLHRNLSPHNVLLDPVTGQVKLCDLAHARACEAPPRPYSPEDMKLRAQSSREMRRLWYRAPERLLRQPVYDSATDVWSAGALLAEASRGEPLFPSESEVDHLFRVFRFSGTPSQQLWSEALALPNFSVHFPVYEPVDLRRAARMAKGVEDFDQTLRKALDNRPEVVETAIACCKVIGLEGVALLSSLLHLDPRQRCSAEGALESAFLRRGQAPVAGAAVAICATPQIAATTFCRCGASSQSATPVGSSQASSQSTPATHVAKRVAQLRLTSSSPSMGIVVGRRSSCTTLRRSGGCAASRGACRSRLPLWDEMAALDASIAHTSAVAVGAPSAASSSSGASVASVASADSEDFSPAPREEVVDGMVGLASDLRIGDLGLHLGVALLDAASGDRGPAFPATHGAADGVEGAPGLERELLAAVCLKLADTFDEHSQEYYQRERTQQYVRALRERWSEQAVINAEKQVTKALGFWFHRPTVAWFLRTCIFAGGPRLLRAPGVVSMARFLADLALLDSELLVFPPALRAQVVLLLSTYFAVSRTAAMPSLCGTPFGNTEGSCSQELVELWAPVRRSTCSTNRRSQVASCLARIVHSVLARREALSARGLRAVERRHPEASRRPLPAGLRLPPALVEELLPLAQPSIAE